MDLVVTPPPAGERESSAARIPRAAAWILLGLLLWAQRARFPESAAPPELDPSWQQGLAYAIAHGLQFGPDLIFTFGPLGAFSLARYEPGITWIGLVLFELVFKGLLAWRWIDTVRRWPTALDRAAFLGTILVLAPSLDAFYFASTVMLAARHLAPPPEKGAGFAWSFLLDALLLSAIALIKFTYLVLVVIALVAILTPAWRRDRRVALRRLGLACAAFVGLWTALGQAPWHLPLYLRRSLQIVSGYTEAQAEPGSGRELALALLWAAVAFVLCLATMFSGSSDRPRAERFWRGALLLGGGFLAFRASFTYHVAHGFTFFGYALLAPAILSPAVDATVRQRVALGIGRLACFVVALLGLASAYSSVQEMIGLTWNQSANSLARRVAGLGELDTLEERLESERRELATKFALPRIASTIGSSTVDLFGNEQAWVFLNGLDWRPRPVFQSYLTVTPALLSANAQFFRGHDAPEFVMVQMGTISRRLAGMDDSAAMTQILHDYDPVAVEKGMLLLRRDPRRAAEPPARHEVLEEREVAPGEIVRLDHLPGEALRVRILVEPSALGLLRRFLLRAPALVIRLKMHGQEFNRRLVSSMSSSGVLLRPYVESSEDFMQLYTRGLPKRINSFSVSSREDWGLFFQPKYRVIVERCDGVLPVPDVARERPLVCGSLPSQPSLLAATSAARHFQFEDRDVLLLPPGARLGYDVAPGAHRLRGAFGMLPNGREHSDGIDFVIALVDADGSSRELLRRWIEPRAGGDLHVPLDLAFEAAPGEQLRLTVENPPGRSDAFDLPYWEGLRLE